VYRLFDAWSEVTVLQRTDTGWETIAAIEDDAPPDVGVTGRTRTAVSRALRAAEVNGAAVTTVFTSTAPQHATEVAAAIRRAGVGAPVRTVGDFDAVYGALNREVDRARPDRLRLTRHAVAIAVPLTGAPALLWLLQRTGVERARLGSELSTHQPPPFMYTIWPTWSLVAVLVVLTALGITLLTADIRYRRTPRPAEDEQRRYLARGLRITGVSGIIAGLVTTMQALAVYTETPTWWFLLWTTAPAAVTAAALATIAGLVQRGYTSAIRWQIWLRFPNTATLLLTAGVIAIEVYQYVTTSDFATLLQIDLPDSVATLGTIAAGLSASALLIPRPVHQVIASPAVIGGIAVIHTYTNMTIILDILLVTIVAWWLVRIRPAAAFSNPAHPATILASRFDPVIEDGSRPVPERSVPAS
jgi:hypothetical protein